MDNQADAVLAQAVRFLIDGGEVDAANILLACTLEIRATGEVYSSFTGPEFYSPVYIEFTGPRAAYDVLHNREHPLTQQIERAFNAVWADDYEFIHGFSAHIEQTPIDPDWRSELLEIARGKGVNNQVATGAKNIRVWKNLNFRSQSEIKIAEALDRKGLLFLPNCKARLGTLAERANKEADFLVCDNGHWGILEVDGEEFHPPTRTVQDHDRDRLFRNQGIRVVEHFDATRCYNTPDEVVKEFLKILHQAYE